MLKHRNFVEKKFNDLDLKDEYARRVDQKLNKKFGFKNSNFKVMSKNDDADGECEKQIQVRKLPFHSYEKKVRYLKVPADEQVWQAESVHSDEEPQKCLETELYDEYQQEQEDNKSDFLQMALYYKNLCRTYKKQLIESHKTIRDLNAAIDQMEHKNWMQK